MGRRGQAGGDWSSLLQHFALHHGSNSLLDPCSWLGWDQREAARQARGFAQERGMAGDLAPVHRGGDLLEDGDLAEASLLVLVPARAGENAGERRLHKVQGYEAVAGTDAACGRRISVKQSRRQARSHAGGRSLGGGGLRELLRFPVLGNGLHRRHGVQR